MTRNDAIERYRRDPEFEGLVDLMVQQAITLRFSPGELREAALRRLAAAGETA